MSRTTDEIIALEKRFWTEADDGRYFAERFADDGITVLSMGFVDKEKALGMVAEEPWQDVEIRDVAIHELTPDVVTLAYHGQGRHAGDEEPYRATIASTWIKRDGRWQLAMTAHQPWQPVETAGGDKSSQSESGNRESGKG